MIKRFKLIFFSFLTITFALICWAQFYQETFMDMSQAEKKMGTQNF